MAGRIRFSAEELAALRESLLSDFTKELEKLTGPDATVSFSRTIKNEKKDAGTVRVCFTPTAFVKMITLLDASEDEIAWHGLVDNPEPGLYLITDILVYPQTVTGVTVETDQEQYTEWLMGLPDEVFNRLHMQGHSHVRMATSPSTTDMTHQQQIVRQLTANDFYIFMIFNKRLERNVRVYDMRTNTLYENNDVSIGIQDEGFDQDAFLKEATGMVTKRTPVVYAGAKPVPVSRKVEKKGGYKPQKVSATKNNGWSYDEDDNDWWSYRAW